MSSYIFRGRLCGLICNDCPEPLADVTVRLYRLRDDRNAAALAVADPKETAAVLNAEQIKAKEKFLLAEVQTDGDGNFTAELGEKQKYDGEAFQIDVYCQKVPGQKGEGGEPRQFSITTLQPRWAQRENGFVAVWDYCIPYRFWCYFRSLFRAWTICGRVTTCGKEGVPVSNVTVTAFDADWLQDDPLGSGVTNGAGMFRIDYTDADFKKTPFSPLLNVELTSGPDVYFAVESSAGQTLLAEPRSRGRQADRENAGPCLCVKLCVDVKEEPPVDNPLFTHVGDFHIYGDIDPATGLTNNAVLGHGGPGFGFFGALKLKGYCPKTVSGSPARYRFLYQNLTDGGPLVPITGALLSPVHVGSRLILWDTFGTGPAWTFQSVYVQGSGATPSSTPSPALPPGTPWGPPPPHVLSPGPDGWIDVEQNGLDGGFYGPLVRFNTTQVLAAADAPDNGAGNAVSDPKSGIDLRVVYEVGPVSGGTAFTNELGKVRVNNWGEVNLLDLQEFGGGGTPCSRITDTITIQYTVDHELTAAWDIGISGPAMFPPLPSGNVPRGGYGIHPVDVSDWPSCAYIISLRTRRRLTDGENDDSARTVQRVFCK